MGKDLVLGEAHFLTSFPSISDIEYTEAKEFNGMLSVNHTGFSAEMQVNPGDVYLLRVPLYNNTDKPFTLNMLLTYPEGLGVIAFGSDDIDPGESNRTRFVTKTASVPNTWSSSLRNVKQDTWSFTLMSHKQGNNDTWDNAIGIIIIAGDDIVPGSITITGDIYPVEENERLVLAGVTTIFNASNLKPGDIVGPARIVLINDGNIKASSFDINVFYSEKNASPETQSTVTADQFAGELLVNRLSFNGVDLLELVTDSDGDGIDMREVAAADLTAQVGIPAGGRVEFIIQVTLKDVGNEFQGQGIEVFFTFSLNQ